MNSFRNLDAYIEGKNIVKEVYCLLKQFPVEERYAMCDQIRRAAISITSNIAEGSGRKSTKEKIHFIEISYGSLMEVLSQLDIACDLKYITQTEFNDIEKKIDHEARLLSGLNSYFERQLPNP